MVHQKTLIKTLLFLLLPLNLLALSPTRSQHAWVAGTGEVGNADGPFMSARFNKPEGILFDAASHRLIVADSGNQSLRLVALAEKNSTSTLRLQLSGSAEAFPFYEPSLLAWKQEGKELYCYDKKKPGVALIDLGSRTARWLPLSRTNTSKAGQSYILSGATTLASLPGKFGVLAFSRPEPLLLFDLPGDNSVMLNVNNAPGAIDDLVADSNGFWAMSRDAHMLFRLTPSGAPADWLNALADSVTSTATAPDLGANTQVAQALERPWSFVRTSQGLKVACDSATIMAYMDAGGNFKLWHMIDQRGKKIGLENDLVFSEDGSVLRKRTQYLDTMGAKRLFKRPQFVCEDPSDQRWYLCETESNRIVSFMRSEPDEPMTEAIYNGLKDTFFPLTRTPGVKRIALFSSCYLKEVKDTHRKMDTFSKRFQWYLNLFSSLKNGDAYEAMFFGSTVPPETSLMSELKRTGPRAVEEYQADELIVAMRPRDLVSIVRGYQNYAIDSDGLPQLAFDPEYKFKKRSWADVSGNPAYLDLLKYAVAHPQDIFAMQVQGGQDINILDDDSHWPEIQKKDYTNAIYLKKLVELNRHDLGIIKGQLEAKARRPLSITFMLYPEHGNIGPQELYTDDFTIGQLDIMRKLLKAMCADLGIRYLDVVDEMRVYSLDSPFIEVQDGHPTQNGTDILGLVAANRYLEPAGAASVKPSAMKKAP